MRNAVVTSLIVAGSLAVTGLASSQSLAEVAKKEKARRAKIAEQGKSAEVVDAHTLRRVQGSKFTAVEVTGAPERRSSSPAVAPRPAPTNPNRRAATETAPPNKNNKPVPQQDRPLQRENTEMGRGWSKKPSAPTTGRGWDHRRKEILESMGRHVTPLEPKMPQKGSEPPR